MPWFSLALPRSDSRSRSQRLVAACAGLIVLSLATVSVADEVRWKRIKLDSDFRSEGVTAFDVNKDGKMDVVTGDIWYEAPDFIRHEIRPSKVYDGAAGYSQSFANFHFDVNADGWEDVITIGFPGEKCHWYQNPAGGSGVKKGQRRGVCWPRRCGG